jgi:hypothetical protein
MKKIRMVLLLIICINYINAQSLQLSNNTEGISSFKQPSTSKFTPELQVSLSNKQPGKVQVKENNGSFNLFSTQSLSDNWIITTTPVYVKVLGYGKKQTFLKMKVVENNSAMWVVRILKEYDNNNQLKRTIYIDSTRFPNVLTTTINNLPKAMPGTPVFWVSKFTISNIQFETLYVDDENVEHYRNTSEYSGNLDFIVFEKKASVNKKVASLDDIFLKQSSQFANSYIPMEKGKKYPSHNPNELTIVISSDQFDYIELRVKGSLTDVDPTKAIGSSTVGLMKELQELNEFTSIQLKNCNWGNNLIDIKEGKYIFRVHFNLKASN